LARIEENVTIAAGATARKALKAGKAAPLKEQSAGGPEGVVYKVRNAFSISFGVA
jgi:hypothetical protein